MLLCSRRSSIPLENNCSRVELSSVENTNPPLQIYQLQSTFYVPVDAPAANLDMTTLNTAENQRTTLPKSQSNKYL
ncbi:hypothetical protein AM571_CH01457 [Rhizobium etli 8C-3]|uniref:Uncharacterized protein n=1 Tax=Rhizobium etli 8C-3 TaxID=538025 RepID=A0A1L5P297_RHIET|nr:hypothetical protein AM571_CH01457 [Rhizobium etli 8C-3]